MSKNKGFGVLIGMIVLLLGCSFITIFGVDSARTGSAYNIKQGLDLAGGVSITYQVVGEETPSESDMKDTIYKLQQRVENYSTESQVYQEGVDRINIEIPGVSDANAVLEELGKPGSLLFLNVEGEEVITGVNVKDAKATTNLDSMGNKDFVVSLLLDKEGAEKFAVATTEAVKTFEPILIVYDDEVISAPTVQSAITDGQVQISGMGSFAAAEDLASTIRIGGLKLELEELRSNVVGAQLGAEAIDTSLKAGVIGLACVMLFMIVIYFIPGVASALALAIYVVLMLLSLNAFNVTLTLPGIAGIILSIGMAVDANVIIFARIREELATGKTVQSSIKIGFQKALSAILDGNITTLIAALVLGFMGTGSVKGFAQTLAIGIVLSMFTALVITKLILKSFFAIGLQNVKFYGIGKERKTINFLSKKNIFFIASIAVILAGFVFMGINKSQTGDVLNYSLEFEGGTSTKVTFNEALSIEDIEDKVVPVVSEITGDKAIQTQKVTGTNEVIIKTRTLEVDERELLNLILIEEFQVEEDKITAETISSTISSEMRQDALVAVLIATACMLLYIWIRFKDVRFAASAVIALIHDVLIVLAFYAVAQISVGNTFIACMLTILGYSVNATIVIFDRIRENMEDIKRKEELKELVNRSISQTLSRSIFTSLTTFFMVATLYVMGVTSIREFALPLIVGIVCGAYSSVCITGSLWYCLRIKFVKQEE